MRDTERDHDQVVFESLLRTKGYVGDVIRRLISRAKKTGFASCEYMGIELRATPSTTERDLDRVYSMACLSRRNPPLRL
jgi:hypothetical protein